MVFSFAFNRPKLRGPLTSPWMSLKITARSAVSDDLQHHIALEGNMQLFSQLFIAPLFFSNLLSNGVGAHLFLSVSAKTRQVRFNHLLVVVGTIDGLAWAGQEEEEEWEECGERLITSWQGQFLSTTSPQQLARFPKLEIPSHSQKINFEVF